MLIKTLILSALSFQAFGQVAAPTPPPNKGITEDAKASYYKTLSEFYGAQAQFQNSLSPEQKNLTNAIGQKEKALDAQLENIKKQCISEGKRLDDTQRTTNNILVCATAAPAAEINKTTQMKGPNNK